MNTSSRCEYWIKDNQPHRLFVFPRESWLDLQNLRLLWTSACSTPIPTPTFHKIGNHSQSSPTISYIISPCVTDGFMNHICHKRVPEMKTHLLLPTLLPIRFDTSDESSETPRDGLWSRIKSNKFHGFVLITCAIEDAQKGFLLSCRQTIKEGVKIGFENSFEFACFFRRGQRT